MKYILSGTTKCKLIQNYNLVKELNNINEILKSQQAMETQKDDKESVSH